MVTVDALDQYRAYLEVLDRQAGELGSPSGDDYIDLLSPAEAVDLCLIRDKLAEAPPAADRRDELGRLDALLLKHARVVGDNLPPSPILRPLTRWWWHLAKGPQARDEAVATSEAARTA